MAIKRITAIMPADILPMLEEQLRKCGVSGVTVEHVQGYGVHPNYFRRDLMRENVRIVLYSDAKKVDEYVDAIRHCATQHKVPRGILVAEPIERLVRLTDAGEHDSRQGVEP